MGFFGWCDFTVVILLVARGGEPFFSLSFTVLFKSTKAMN